MTIYGLDIDESDLLEYMECHEQLDDLDDDVYERVTASIVEKASESRDGLYTEFGLWFINSTYWDQAWDVLQQAMLEYIGMVTPLVLKDMEE